MDSPESSAVVSRVAMDPERFLVGRSRVALVAVPSVFRVVHRQGRHALIAVRFGQDARRRDGQESAIPLDFAGVGNVVGAEPISVDEQVLWTEPELSLIHI